MCVVCKPMKPTMWYISTFGEIKKHWVLSFYVFTHSINIYQVPMRRKTLGIQTLKWLWSYPQHIRTLGSGPLDLMHMVQAHKNYILWHSVAVAPPRSGDEITVDIEHTNFHIQPNKTEVWFQKSFLLIHF